MLLCFIRVFINVHGSCGMSIQSLSWCQLTHLTFQPGLPTTKSVDLHSVECLTFWMTLQYSNHLQELRGVTTPVLFRSFLDWILTCQVVWTLPNCSINPNNSNHIYMYIIHYIWIWILYHGTYTASHCSICKCANNRVSSVCTLNIGKA